MKEYLHFDYFKLLEFKHNIFKRKSINSLNFQGISVNKETLQLYYAACKDYSLW